MKTTSSALFAGALALAGAFAITPAGHATLATMGSTGEYIDDSAITAKVKAALLKDDAVKSFEIHVTTFKGVVQLSGSVDNSDQSSAAKNDAESVPGVKSVTNNLTVKSS